MLPFLQSSLWVNMTTNKFVNTYQAPNEQYLVANLVEETIKFHGIDVYYFPRTLVKVDKLFMEDPLSKFNRLFEIECYIKSVNGFEGQGDILTKFNLELRDEIVVVFSRRRFEEEVGIPASIVRPNEGDIIFFPLGKDYFEVKFVEHESIFYQLGSLYIWEVRCEKFEYSSERFETGTDHDADMAEYSYDLVQQAITTSDGEILATEDGEPIIFNPLLSTTFEPLSQNQVIQDEAEINFDFTQPNPYVKNP